MMIDINTGWGTNGTDATKGKAEGQLVDEVTWEGFSEENSVFTHKTAFSWKALSFLAFGVNCWHIR